MELNWYLVELLFACRPSASGETVWCEACHVLFCTSSGDAAYECGLDWAKSHSASQQFEFVGIQHLSMLDEAPAHGVEISGQFFEAPDPWIRQLDLIPAREEIPTLNFEANPATPVGELLSEKHKEEIRRFGESSGEEACD